MPREYLLERERERALFYFYEIGQLGYWKCHLHNTTSMTYEYD